MDLSQFSLFRNDPQAAADVLEHALAGDVDAQFMAGLIYAEGRGVKIDLVQSFYWFSVAMEHGDRDAEHLRCVIGARMSEEEYQQAQRLLRAAKQAGPGEGGQRRH